MQIAHRANSIYRPDQTVSMHSLGSSKLVLDAIPKWAGGSFWSYRGNILAGVPKGVDSVNKL